MRQKDDSTFVHLLNRLRVKVKNEELSAEDHSILESCTQRSLPSDVLHIFGTNKEVDSHNSKMINLICKETKILEAQDYDRNPQTGKLSLRKTPIGTTHDFLPSQLVISPKARVMLIRNVDISCGLVNGAIGTVKEVKKVTFNSANSYYGTFRQ